MRACVVSPMPRRGEFTIRENATASDGFAISVRYAIASFTSARS